MRRDFRLTMLFLLPIVWAAYVFWRLPVLLETRQLLYVFTPWTVLIPASAFSGSLALILTLIRWNWRRWRVVFMPNPGRLLGAFGLTAATPILSASWVPVPAGILSPGLWLEEPSMLLAIGGIFVGWYPVAALLVSGIKSWNYRFAGFLLMYAASYSLHHLVAGVIGWRQ